MGEARHGHDAAGETKVRLHREAAEAKVEEKGDIRTRIQAILHAPTEKPVVVAPPKMAPVDLTNEAILGKAMATQQQCVQYLLSVNPAPALSISPQKSRAAPL